MLKLIQYKEDVVKKLLFTLIALSPMVLFASEGVETDIFQRTVNFIIFAAIIYYLLADRARAFFGDRSAAIQAELEKVQDLKKETEAKVENAQAELEKAKQIADEIVKDAQANVDSIKNKIEANMDQEISQLMKNLDEKLDVESKKIKREVVEEILEELLKDENINVTQDSLTSIILSKVA